MADACYKRRNGKMDHCEDNRQLSVHSASKRNVEVQKTALRACADWTEHLSSSGRIYYYNSKTEVSRWEKPKEWGIETHAIVLNNVKVELPQSSPVDPRHATRSNSKQTAIDDPVSTQVRTVDKNVVVPEHSTFSYPLASFSAYNGRTLTPYQWNVKNMPSNCRQWRDVGSSCGNDCGMMAASWGLPLTCDADPRLVNRELTPSIAHDASNDAACANNRLPACSQLQQHVAGRRLPTAQLTPTLTKHFNAHLIRHSDGWISDSLEKQIELMRKKRHKLCCQHDGYNGLELKRARALVQLADTRATAKEHRKTLLQQRLMVVESVSTVGVTSTTADLDTVASL